jgi:phage terminase large subunit-like protein
MSTSRPRSGRLLAARAKAKRGGWLDWVRTEADERALLDGCYFDRRRADHVVEFGRLYLRHTQGDFAGKPFALLDWQEDQLFRPLFGWVYDSEEYGRTIRRFRRAYVRIPKKNGKSAIASYLALYMTLADGEPGAECYSASTDKNQASIVWLAAVEMAEQSPAIAKTIRVNRVIKNLAHHDTSSFYRVLSACPRRNEGWKAHLIVADELHKWYGRELFDALKWAFASRSQPMLFMITTSGDDPTSVCHEQDDYAQQVLRGDVKDQSFFPLLYGATPRDDVHDETTWFRANPSLGRTPDAPLKLSSFRTDYEEAKQSHGLFESWKQLRLNVWRKSAAPWIDTHRWDAGSVHRDEAGGRIDCWEPFAAEDLHGWDCWAGMDLALTTDLSAFVMVFPDDLEAASDDVVYRVLPMFWLPERTAERFGDRVPYRHWQSQGWITLTPGSETDFDRILADIATASERYNVQQVAYDRMLASYVSQRIEQEVGIERIEFGQNSSNYTEPCKLFERLVSRCQIRHNGNACLSWCVGNTTLKVDAGGRCFPIKPDGRRDHRRIDGTVATLMGLAITLRGEVVARPDYYDEHDVEWV